MRFNLTKLILILAGVLFVAVFSILGFVDLSKWIRTDAGNQPAMSTRTKVDIARLVEQSDALGSGQMAAGEGSGVSDVQGNSGKIKASETEKLASENDPAKPSNKRAKPEKGVAGQAVKAEINKGAPGAAVRSGPSATDAPKAMDKQKRPPEGKSPPVVVAMRKDAPGDTTSKQAKASDKAGSPKDHNKPKQASRGGRSAQQTTLPPDETEQTGSKPKTKKDSGAESAESVKEKPLVTLNKGKKQNDIESKRASAEKKVASSARQDPMHGKTKSKEGKLVPDGGHNVRKVYIRTNEGRIRERPSLGAPIKTTLKAGTELLAGDKKGAWYAVRLKDGREGWGHQSILRDTPIVAAASAGKDQSTSSSRKINRIRTEKLSDHEVRVIFELNGKHPPKVFTIKGKKPRMVCDFPNTKISGKVKLTRNIESGILKRIRVGVHRRPTPKTRVVLDFVDNLNFVTQPEFIEKSNNYAVVIRRQG